LQHWFYILFMLCKDSDYSLLLNTVANCEAQFINSYLIMGID